MQLSTSWHLWLGLRRALRRDRLVANGELKEFYETDYGNSAGGLFGISGDS